VVIDFASRREILPIRPFITGGGDEETVTPARTDIDHSPPVRKLSGLFPSASPGTIAHIPLFLLSRPTDLTRCSRIDVGT